MSCECVHADHATEWEPGTYPPDVWGSISGGGTPPGGGGAQKGPPLISITPDTMVAGVLTQFVLIGEGFTSSSAVAYRFADIAGADWDRWPNSVYISETEIHVAGNFVEARPIDVAVRDGLTTPVGDHKTITVV
jgi:hypothetical protein